MQTDGDLVAAWQTADVRKWSRPLSRPGCTATVAGAILCIAGCGGSQSHSSTFARTVTTAPSTSIVAAPGLRVRSHAPQLTAVLPATRRRGLFMWTPAVAVRGQSAVWISRVKAAGERGFTVTLLRFDQRLVTLALHAGGTEPGGSGWRYGDVIGRPSGGS